VATPRLLVPARGVLQHNGVQGLSEGHCCKGQHQRGRRWSGPVEGWKRRVERQKKGEKDKKRTDRVISATICERLHAGPLRVSINGGEQGLHPC